MQIREDYYAISIEILRQVRVVQFIFGCYYPGVAVVVQHCRYQEYKRKHQQALSEFASGLCILFLRCHWVVSFCVLLLRGSHFITSIEIAQLFGAGGRYRVYVR
jgi:hypothetical protein